MNDHFHDPKTESVLRRPVVVVAGDFDETSLGGFFTARVWEGIAESYSSCIPWPKVRDALQYPASLTQYDHLRASPLCTRAPRSVSRTPDPLALSHGGDAGTKHFRTHLRLVLDAFDVWGVVATGHAKAVAELRDQLVGIDIPFLVTTDSTSGPDERRLPGELRLIADNRAQAWAMLLEAAINSASRTTPIYYVADEDLGADVYVQDLIRQLEEAAWSMELTLKALQTGDLHKVVSHPLLIIGYSRFAAMVIDRCMSERNCYRGAVTIMSDGCAVKDIPVKLRQQPAEMWLLAVPNHQHKFLGVNAMSAIARTGSTILRHPTATTVRRMPPFSELVREQLEQSAPDSFTFRNGRNIAARFRIQPAIETEAKDLIPFHKRAI